jgi:hypothetical protein
VFDGPKTPPPSEVAMFVGTAQNAGLRVELRPLLEVGTAGYIWRGLIHPSDATAFFDSYGQALAPYAELAQQLGVSGFVYASELYSLSRSPDYEPSWSQLISQLSSFYHGPLVYAESGAQYLSGADVVPDLTTYGEYTDAYFGAAGATPGSSGTELYNSWASQFDRLATQKSSNTVLQEVGFDAQAIGYEAPQTVAGPPTDSQYLYMQQMWFNMVCSIVHNFDLAGVYFWNIDFNVDPYTTPANDPTLGPTDWVNRPGAAAIASCFSSFGSAG